MGYLEYCGDVSTVGDIMIYMRDIMSAVGFSELWEISFYLSTSMVLNTPHGTHDIPHGTEHPPWYSRYPPRCTRIIIINFIRNLNLQG